MGPPEKAAFARFLTARGKVTAAWVDARAHWVAARFLAEVRRHEGPAREGEARGALRRFVLFRASLASEGRWVLAWDAVEGGLRRVSTAVGTANPPVPAQAKAYIEQLATEMLL